jgi:DNA replication and repair protein RecF
MFLDFGLFHVEPTFHGLLWDFERLLRQRNALLSSRQDRFAAFEPQLIERGERLAESRRRYGERLAKGVTKILENLLPGHPVHFRYSNGWNAQKGFAQALQEVRSTDRKLGYTTVGPQRGGMEIWTESGPAAKVLSRGQQKLLVFGMVLTQATIMAEQTGHHPMLLIDDLSAELDRGNQRRIVELLASLPMQVIMTNIEQQDDWSHHLSEVFHVEHLARFSDT